MKPATPHHQPLRVRMKIQRAALDPQQVNTFSRKAVANLLRLPEFEPCRRIAAYVAIKGEIDPETALQKARSLGKDTFLPVIHDNILKFAAVTDNTKWHTGKYGIPFPEHNSEDCLDARLMDIVIVPLLAFDASCNRIGMGGGYYDRTFNFRKKLNAPPLLVAIAYEFQKAANLTMQTWDVPMDRVVTDLQIYG